MLLVAGREAGLGVGAGVYERHCPERTVLYHLVQEYFPALKPHLAAQGRSMWSRSSRTTSNVVASSMVF